VRQAQTGHFESTQEHQLTKCNETGVSRCTQEVHDSWIVATYFVIKICLHLRRKLKSLQTSNMKELNRSTLPMQRW